MPGSLAVMFAGLGFFLIVVWLIARDSHILEQRDRNDRREFGRAFRDKDTSDNKHRKEP